MKFSAFFARAILSVLVQRMIKVGTNSSDFSSASGF
jgi:hypothetical protein